jgi:transcription elongation factor Elf1
MTDQAEELIRRLEGKMTTEEYLANRGLECPFCREENLSIRADEADVNDDALVDDGELYKVVAYNTAFNARRRIICESCGKKYQDIYTLTGYEELPE